MTPEDAGLMEIHKAYIDAKENYPDPIKQKVLENWSK